VYGCGEFGLKEYELDEKGEVKDQYSLIGKIDFLKLFRGSNSLRRSSRSCRETSLHKS